VLGWIIVVPALLGVLLGRWLDRSFSTGIVFTAALLLLGVLLGSWSAWRWMHDR
jgi:ATP synthase protein I